MAVMLKPFITARCVKGQAVGHAGSASRDAWTPDIERNNPSSQRGTMEGLPGPFSSQNDNVLSFLSKPEGARGQGRGSHSLIKGCQSKL